VVNRTIYEESGARGKTMTRLRGVLDHDWARYKHCRNKEVAYAAKPGMSDLYRDIALVSVFCHDRSASATASIRFTVSIASTHHSIRFDLLPPMRHRVDSVKVRRLADGVTATSASTNLTDHPTITCQEVGVIDRVSPVRPSHG
jgi:hypothetical protein